MTTPFNPLKRVLGTASVAVACLLALPQNSQARDHDDDQHDHGHHKSSHHGEHSAYYSHPRSGFTLSLGDGYRGRGYYYGPPHSTYYYERPEVTYYATREAAPREYYTRESSGESSPGAAVQSALAQRGYYHGSIDGAIGPQSRRAIARYQEDHHLRPTGTISPSLMQSLGL